MSANQMPGGVGRETEPEITPEMVDAGLQALFEFRGDGDVVLVTEIARAVLRQLSGRSCAAMNMASARH